MLNDYGYDTIELNGVHARGYRPLLVVLINGEGRPVLAHDASYYDTLFFGERDSIAAYFSEISNGRNSIVRMGAGVSGPLYLSKYEMALGLEERFAIIKRKLIDAGYAYHYLDSNSDGIVGPEELCVVVIDSDSTSSGATRSTDARFLDADNLSVKWLGDVSAVGHQSSFMTIAHEILHAMGITADMYGSNDLNNGYTAMNNAGPGFESRACWHLDPFHKMKLGWCEPRLVNGLDKGVFVVKTHRQGNVDAPVLLYDPNNSKLFFMIEFRTRFADVIYDNGLPSNGIAIWSVAVDNDKNVYEIPGLTSGSDWSINLMGPPNLSRGSGPLWRAGDTPILNGDWKRALRISSFNDYDKAVSIEII